MFKQEASCSNIPRGTLLDKHVGWLFIFHLIQSKKAGKDQESIQSSTTPDPGYQCESNKLTTDITNESQEVSFCPAGDHKAAISINRGSYMSAHVLLNLLNELGKEIKCDACRAFYLFFATSSINSIIQEHEC